MSGTLPSLLSDFTLASPAGRRTSRASHPGGWRGGTRGSPPPRIGRKRPGHSWLLALVITLALSANPAQRGKVMRILYILLLGHVLPPGLYGAHEEPAANLDHGTTRTPRRHLGPRADNAERGDAVGPREAPFGEPSGARNDAPSAHDRHPLRSLPERTPAGYDPVSSASGDTDAVTQRAQRPDSSTERGMRDAPQRDPRGMCAHVASRRTETRRRTWHGGGCSRVPG